MAHYEQHLVFLEGLNAIGDITSLSEAELTKYIPGLDVLHQSEMEIGNIAPECFIEDGYATRCVT